MVRNLLIVDDNPADVRYTVEMLNEAGIESDRHVVGDGVEALRFLRRRGEYTDAPRPDLVLLDWYLPRKDGREVLAELRSDERVADVPVVVLAGSHLEAETLRTESKAADAYAVKPLEPDGLRGYAERLGGARRIA
ncbi:response regulator [Natronococcus sp. JC468]|uniref:response regulator n=1 Tax=Natronococcus sp. JC468 TaxID=1961921 RepID=UPI001439D8C3|nr:response regulator [Natronococcus sp. JC468]NKE35406.1 response regulator [Natronococcus sp. JC468]